MTLATFVTPISFSFSFICFPGNFENRQISVSSLNECGSHISFAFLQGSGIFFKDKRIQNAVFSSNNFLLFFGFFSKYANNAGTASLTWSALSLLSLLTRLVFVPNILDVSRAIQCRSNEKKKPLRYELIMKKRPLCRK